MNTQIKLNYVIEDLVNIEKDNGYITRDDIQRVFKVDKYDRETILKAFWKADFIFRSDKYGQFKFKLSYMFKNQVLGGLTNEIRC